MRHPIRNPALNAALCAALLIGLPLSASAQGAAPQVPTPEASSASAPSGLPWTNGEVRRIDATAGKISLRHGEIQNLDMPPMTMVFQVRDPARLAPLVVGDRVRFTADRSSAGFTVLEIEKQP